MKKIIARALTLVLLFAATVVLVSCKDDFDGCEYAFSRDIAGRDIKYVEISVKDCGRMTVLLDATTAPVTVANFLSLVERGFYDGLTFHRIMEGFMIQGGAPASGEALLPTIKGEFDENGHANDIQHIEGVISMARTSDPDSASSQFFICNDDARSSLDGKYAAFGYVVDGLSTVHKITELGMPKTLYYEYYETNPYIWQAYGNGMIQNKADQPVIEYIKVLENYEG